MSRISDVGKIVNMILKFSNRSEWEAIVKLAAIVGICIVAFLFVMMIWRHV